MTPDEERILLLAQRDELEAVMGHMQIELDEINKKLDSSPGENQGQETMDVPGALEVVAETLRQAGGYLERVAQAIKGTES